MVNILVIIACIGYIIVGGVIDEKLSPQTDSNPINIVLWPVVLIGFCSAELLQWVR